MIIMVVNYCLDWKIKYGEFIWSRSELLMRSNWRRPLKRRNRICNLYWKVWPVVCIIDEGERVSRENHRHRFVQRSRFTLDVVAIALVDVGKSGMTDTKRWWDIKDETNETNLFITHTHTHRYTYTFDLTLFPSFRFTFPLSRISSSLLLSL